MLLLHMQIQRYFNKIIYNTIIIYNQNEKNTLLPEQFQF
jgi:hypothetical protein